ncbi:MAG: NAD(P)H-dependent oxidoreductase subunit E, partial [Dolichospermum sp.]
MLSRKTRALEITCKIGTTVEIPLLWRAQDQCGGWLPEPACRAVSKMLDMAEIRVY